MELIFLGTSSAVHSKNRNHSGIVFKGFGEHILFDCGEATQKQMIFAQVSPMKISKIFLTHYHGDHILGLPGLIESMNFGGREKPLDIYGPKGIEKIATVVRSLSKENFKFEINYHEISEGTIIETEEYVIKSCRVRHNVESLAYSIEEIKKPKFLREKAIALDIPEGPLYGQLQDGNAVELEDGRIIQPEQVLGKERKGVKICYSGDTRLCEEMILFAKESDILIHESTYLIQDYDKAQQNAHSTTQDAAVVARDSNSKQLVLTHISTRYDEEFPIVEEAKEIFENTILAEDLMRIEIK